MGANCCSTRTYDAIDGELPPEALGSRFGGGITPMDDSRFR